MEDLRRIGDALAHLEPMTEVVTHVISGKRTHCHRIAAYYTDCTGGCCRSLGCHDRSDKGSILPTCRLIYQRSSLCTAPSEYDRGNRHALRIVEFGREAGAVSCLGGKAGVGMSAAGALVVLVVHADIPLVSAPVDSV